MRRRRAIEVIVACAVALLTTVVRAEGVDDRAGVPSSVDRNNGDLYLHWGDWLMLIPPRWRPSGYSLEPLLSRRDEWAGVDIRRDDPDDLWVGIDLRGGRDFVRLNLADVARQAKPWPPKQPQASTEESWRRRSRMRRGDCWKELRCGSGEPSWP